MQGNCGKLFVLARSSTLRFRFREGQRCRCCRWRETRSRYRHRWRYRASSRLRNRERVRIAATAPIDWRRLKSDNPRISSVLSGAGVDAIRYTRPRLASRACELPPESFFASDVAAACRVPLRIQHSLSDFTSALTIREVASSEGQFPTERIHQACAPLVVKPVRSLPPSHVA